MDLFTVDRSGLLSKGHVCALTEYADVAPPEINALVRELCPGGVSFHGEAYLLKNDRSTNITDANTEIIFEWVRRANFPDRPSRYQSLYAVDNLNAAQTFMNMVGAADSPVFRLVSERAFRADMRLLIANNSAVVKSYFASLYWQGLPFPQGEPQWEWLVPCPVVIGERIG